MEKLETNEVIDMNDIMWELTSLAWWIWANEWVAEVAAKELNEWDKMSDTMGCVLTTNMDATMENPKKFKQLSKQQQELLVYIVNNGRWEWLARMYNENINWKRHEIKSLIEKMSKVH